MAEAPNAKLPLAPRLLALAGLIGQIVFVTGVLVAGFVQGDAYSIADHEISDMGARGAPHAWVLLSAQLVCGVLTLAFVVFGFAPSLSGIRGSKLSTVLLALWGLGNLSDAFFRLDCRAADGCTPEQAVMSWQATIHSVGGLSLIVFAFAPYVVARCLRRSPDWQPLARPTVLLGIAIDGALVATLALSESAGGGYAQRVLALLLAAWFAMLALRLLRLDSRQDSER